MALITCPECSNQVSTEANACPSCGYPVSQRERSDATAPQPATQVSAVAAVGA